MRMRDAIGRLAVMAGEAGTGRTLRRMALGTGALLRRDPGEFRRRLDGMGQLMEKAEAEAASWLTPDRIAAGDAGAFDVRDLRAWLVLAERAGVPHVPARPILSLDEDELSAISRPLALPDHVSGALGRGLRRVFGEIPGTPPSGPGADPSAIVERLHAAMDDLPSDWMVRSHISGSHMLKALAGSGTLQDGRDGAMLAPDIEVGAGWVRSGNRRRIDATDTRFIETFAAGPGGTLHFLARPWMTPARHGEGEDPHRHGTVFAGKGRWPMEWRCFVEAGRVTGVAAYYGWVGSVTPENAVRALEAVDLARRIVEAGQGADLRPRWMDIELLRDASPEALSNPKIRNTLSRFPRNGFACTLDFIETVDGMMLLEGGPPHTPIGGGHPCAFAGHEMHPDTGCRTEGVALRLIDGVTLADPSSWSGRRNDGAILDFDTARMFATQHVEEFPEYPDMT